MKWNRDLNEPEIAQAFEARWFLVERQGPGPDSDGIPDLLVASPWFCDVETHVEVRRELAVVEVKNSKTEPNKRRLRPSQARWHGEWRGAPVYVVETTKGVDDVCDEIMARAMIGLDVARARRGIDAAVETAKAGGALLAGQWADIDAGLRAIEIALGHRRATSFDRRRPFP